MRNSTRKRKPPQEATGTCRWVVTPNVYGHGRLSINGTEYDVTPIRRKDTKALVCYTLAKDDGTVYACSPERNTCDCPDAVYNRPHATRDSARVCKHCRALGVALAAMPQKPVPALLARILALKEAG